MSAASEREAAPLTLDDFCARARQRLHREAPDFAAVETLPAVGDRELTPSLVRTTGPHRPAAVLVPIVARAEPTVLFTLRTPHLSRHAGQISFPGGKVDPADASPLVAALRETEEEIGLDRSLVSPLGYLDLYATGTGFRILPVVGLVPPEHSLTLNPAEVAEAFEVPLSFLMSPGNHLRHSRTFDGVERFFHAVPYGERYIWGATAGMVKNLHDRLYG